MKKVFRILERTVLVLVVMMSLFACYKIKEIKEIMNIVETTEAKEEVVVENNKGVEDEFGDKLIELKSPVSTKSRYQLPEVGESLYGFTVKAIYDYEDRDAKVVLFEHDKVGTKLFLISNNDEDKLAAFGFNTLTFDNKGIPHVFEHACLGGSEKYPNANLFMEAVNRTYNTYMNAFTMQHTTVYPISSLSDVQLFELYKFYIDGVLNPNVLRDEKNLECEAYRYSLYNKNDDIELKGIVYSEMSGVEGNISNVAYRNSLKTMFNDSFMGMNTGGATSDIPNITNEELIGFHEKYYHPSNMIITLYGDIDYKKYLKYAEEEYLHKYERKVIEKNDPNYNERNEFDIVKYDFPVASDAETKGQTVIDFNVVCDGMSAYESGIFELVLSALENSDGPIKTRLLERLPNADFEILNGLYLPKPYFSIVFNNVDDGDDQIIKGIVEESFDELVDKGISEDILKDILNYIEWEKETKKDSHGFAGDTILFYGRAFSTNGEDILGYFRHDKAMGDIETAYKNGVVKELINKYLNAKNKFSMDKTVPKKGLLEENSEKLKQELKKMKEGLTDDEINELISKTKEFDSWAKDQSENTIIDKLRVATISELDEYRAKCYAYEENSEGISFIRSDIDGCKYNYYNILFDISNLTIEEAMKLKFASSLLKELPTTNYTGQKIKAELNKYSIMNDAYIYVNKYYNGGYKPYFAFEYSSLDKNLEDVFILMEELMFETKFEDVNIVKNIVSSDLTSYMAYVSNAPDQVAEEIVTAKTNDDMLYDYSLSGVNYIRFLKKVSEMNDDELSTLLKDCEKIYKNVFNTSGLVCEIIGNFDTIKDIKSRIIDLSHAFKRERIVSNVATLSELRDKIAVVSNGTMNYNYMATPMRKDGIEYNARYAVLERIIDDQILYPEFRVKRSAYGSYSTFNRIHSYVYTYRDPNVKESFDVFNDLPKLVKNIKLTKEELDDYKLRAYSVYAYPLSKMGAAREAVNEALTKVDEKRPDRFIRYMREIKAMTLDDIKELSGILDKIIKDKVYVTVGSKEKIEEDAKLFDEIIYDYVK